MRLFNFTDPILLCHPPLSPAMSLNASVTWVLLDDRPFLAFVLLYATYVYVCVSCLCGGVHVKTTSRVGLKRLEVITTIH